MKVLTVFFELLPVLIGIVTITAGIHVSSAPPADRPFFDERLIGAGVSIGQGR